MVSNKVTAEYKYFRLYGEVNEEKYNKEYILY